MTNKNKATKDDLKSLMEDLAHAEDTQEIKSKLEHALCEQYGDFLADLSAEQIDEIATTVRDFVVLKPVALMTAEAVADKVLFNPTDSRWLADKAVDVITTVIGVGGALWAANRLGISLSEGKSVENPLAHQSSPFSSAAAAEPASVVGKAKSNLYPFDHKAS